MPYIVGARPQEKRQDVASQWYACPSCRGGVAPGAAVCQWCGLRFGRPMPASPPPGAVISPPSSAMAICVVCRGPVAVTATMCPHCGHRLPSAQSGLNGGAICVAIAGVMIGGASILPWETILGVGLNGFDVGTAGVLSVGLGLLVGLPGLFAISGPGIGFGTRLFAFIGGVGAIGLAILGYASIHKQTIGYGISAVGLGVFVVAIGGGLAVAASLFARGKG
jgi:hypothetical protein